MTQTEQDLLQKRLERIVSAGSKMRVAQNAYRKNLGPITREIQQKAEWEFDRLVREENRQLQSKQANIF